MKNPIVVFTSLAAAAIAVLGGTYYAYRAPDAPVAVASAPAPAETPAPAPAPEVKTPEVAAAPAAETPAAPAPAAEAPAAPATETPAPQVAVVTEPPAAPAEAAPAAVTIPSFDTVRVEESGDAVIAGRAEAGSEVTVKWNGNIVGTSTSNADGSFVVIPAKPLAKGTGALTLEVSKNGTTTISEGSVIVAVKADAPALVAKVDPVAPTAVIQSGSASAPGSKELQLSAVDYDSNGNIVFSGNAAPDSIVRFYVDNALTGEGKADKDGRWVFNGTTAVKPGTHSLRADVVDAAGSVMSRIEMPFLREDAQTVAEAQVAMPAPAVAPAPAATPAPAVAATEPAATTPAAEPVIEPATAAPEVVVDAGPRTLVIQPGNNLWKLSRQVYGKGHMFTIIYEANRDQLKNPNRIYPGQILTAPKQN